MLTMTINTESLKQQAIASAPRQSERMAIAIKRQNRRER